MALLNPNDPNSSIDLLLQQEQLAKRKAVADQLVARAGDAEPMTHWAQALAQGVRGITAGLEKRDATEAQMNIAKLLSEGQMAGNAALLKAQGG